MKEFSIFRTMQYGLMPGIIPRLIALFSTGFSLSAYCIANIFYALRLLPRGHVYLNARYIGQFGLRHVMAEGAAHLKFQWRYIDQILVYICMLAGLVLLLAQFILLPVALVSSQPAFSSVNQYIGTYFKRTEEQRHQDLTMIVLDRVFGVPRLFGSCVSEPAVGCTDMDGHVTTAPDSHVTFPWPFHRAIHKLFAFYSTGIFAIASFILIYFVIVLVGESAVSGSPFGQRYNKTWAPLRIILAFALLIPMSIQVPVFGLEVKDTKEYEKKDLDVFKAFNAGQYLTLLIARTGADFASNAWDEFSGSFLDVAIVQPPSLSKILEAVVVAKACALAMRDLAMEGNQNVNANAPAPADDLDYDVIAIGEDPFIWPFIMRSSGFYPPSDEAQAQALSDFFAEQFIPPLDGQAGVVYHFPNSSSTSYTVLSEDYKSSLLHTYSGDMRIVFGTYVADDVESSRLPFKVSPQVYEGNVIPYCGEITFPNVGKLAWSLKDGDLQLPLSMMQYIQRIYYDIIQDMWYEDPDVLKLADCANKHHKNAGASKCSKTEHDLQGLVQSILSKYMNAPPGQELAYYYYDELNPMVYLPAESSADNDYSASTVKEGAQSPALRRDYLITMRIIQELLKRKEESPNTPSALEIGEITSLDIHKESYKNKGWLGASLFYNQIADLNGALVDALYMQPERTKMPLVVEDMLVERKKREENFSFESMFDLTVLSNRVVQVPDGGREVLEIIRHASEIPFRTKLDSIGQEETNLIVMMLDSIFGAGGIYDMRENMEINPLAQLSTLGKSILDVSLRNIAVGSVVGMGLKFFGQGETSPNSARLESLSTFVQSIGYVLLTIGFGLYYVLPMMPFIYFFFAFGGWIKGIFEAVVAMPLFAAAHIARFDGEGIAGPAAQNGYLLLLEIFLRPILILIGFLGSIVVFSASVSVLNEIFDAAVSHVGGHAPVMPVDGADEAELQERLLKSATSGVDDFFFTALYVFVCYFMATSSFKMIDTVPNMIMRWMNFQAKAFQEVQGQMAEGLQGNVYKGLSISTSKLGGLTLDNATQRHVLG